MKNLTLTIVLSFLVSTVFSQGKIERFIKSTNEFIFVDRENTDEFSNMYEYFVSKDGVKFNVKKTKFVIKSKKEKLTIDFTSKKIITGDNGTSSYVITYLDNEDKGYFITKSEHIFRDGRTKTIYWIVIQAGDEYVGYTYINFFPNGTPFK